MHPAIRYQVGCSAYHLAQPSTHSLEPISAALSTPQVKQLSTNPYRICHPVLPPPQVKQLSTKNAQLDQAQTAVASKERELSALTQRLTRVLTGLQNFQVRASCCKA